MADRTLEDSCRILIRRFGKHIRSILLRSDSITLIVSDKKSEISDYAKKLHLHSEVILAKDYFKDVLAGSKETYSSIRESEIIYDPEHMIDPIQEMIKKGEIVGTHESLLRKFLAIGDHFRKIELVKYRVLDNIYRSTLDLSQALLMEKYNIFSTQRDTIKYLGKYLVKKGKLEMKYLNIAKEIIKTFKCVEHKKIGIVSGKELDKLQKNAELFRHRILDLLGNNV